ncbi:hypothetical protein LINPERPRIM_LOCUS16851 [Linum perenne]
MRRRPNLVPRSKEESELRRLNWNLLDSMPGTSGIFPYR